MTTKEQEIKAMVAEKCKEVLAPLYAELEELRTKYYPNEPKVEPTPSPEEIEEAELEEHRKMWRKVAEEMRAKGKL